MGRDINDQWGSMGRNQNGELGDGTQVNSESLVKLNHPEPLTQLAAGCFGGCGLDPVGQVWCWGENRREHLGVPNATPGQRELWTTPQRTGWSRALSSIQTSSGDTFCGQDAATGQTYCWGNDEHCQLGPDSTGGSSGGADPLLALSSPDPVLAPNDEEVAGLTDYSVGAWFVCGLHPQGDIYCWGSDWSSGVPPIALPNCKSKPYRIRSF